MDKLVKKGRDVFIDSYAQLPIVMEKGEGVYLYSTDGKKYLDFVAGIAVNALGYGHEKLQKALKEQVDKFTHCSNLYWNKPSIEVAELLVNYSGLSKVFFCNSGAEAVEAALKLARKYASTIGYEDRFEIITMKQSFHGRTYGAVSVTGQEKYQKGFSPLLPGVKYCEYNDLNSLQETITDRTSAILIEPIQGEGGIRPVDKEYLRGVRRLCDEHNLVLIFDEVQSGIGRTGELFAYQLYGVKPDIVTLAKGLGAGVPIGAIIANDKVARGFQPGDHASTYGGNPLVCTATKIVLEELMENGLLSKVKENGAYLKKQLNKLQNEYSSIIVVRGHGLMLGMELNIPVQKIIDRCMQDGLLLVGAGSNVIRFVPPLIVSKKEIDLAIDILDKALSSVEEE